MGEGVKVFVAVEVRVAVAVAVNVAVAVRVAVTVGVGVKVAIGVRGDFGVFVGVREGVTTDGSTVSDALAGVEFVTPLPVLNAPAGMVLVRLPGVLEVTSTATVQKPGVDPT